MGTLFDLEKIRIDNLDLHWNRIKELCKQAEKPERRIKKTVSIKEIIKFALSRVKLPGSLWI